MCSETITINPNFNEDWFLDVWPALGFRRRSLKSGTSSYLNLNGLSLCLLLGCQPCELHLPWYSPAITVLYFLFCWSKACEVTMGLIGRLSVADLLQPNGRPRRAPCSTYRMVRMLSWHMSRIISLHTHIPSDST